MTQTMSPQTETPTVKVGDFFVCSWGYDQTNVDFYKVVGMTPSGKSVKVQKWSMANDHNDGVHDHMVANDEGGPVMVSDTSAVTPEMDFWERQEATTRKPGPVMTKRLHVGGYKGASFSVNSYSTAYLWDGTPQYQTGWGYGH